MLKIFKFWNWGKKKPSDKFNIELVDKMPTPENTPLKEACEKSNTEKVLGAIIDLDNKGFHSFTSRMVWRHMNGELQPSAISKCLYRLKQRGRVRKNTRLNSKEDESLSYWSLIKND